MTTTLLADTNLLFRRSLRHVLTTGIETGQIEVYIPTLVHAERIRQIAHQKGLDFAIDSLRQAINDAKFKLLPLNVEDAEAVADVWLYLVSQQLATEAYWNKNRFDIILCAIAHARQYPLVSDDQGKHFNFVPQLIRSQELHHWLNKRANS